MTPKSLIKSLAGFASRIAKPIARRRARPEYFLPTDFSRLPADTVALVACHWIGDTFWASQVVQPLKQRFPNANLFAITTPACRDLWNGLLPGENVLIAGEVVSDRRRQEVDRKAITEKARRLRHYNFDLVIDLTGNRYSALFTFGLRPVRSIGFAGDELGWLYSHRVRNAQRPGRHLSERPFRVIEPLLTGWDEPFAYSLPLTPPVSTCPASEIRSELGLFSTSYCILAPGAGWPAKEWPAGRFIETSELLAKSNLRTVVVGPNSQETLCRYVAGRIPGAVCCVGYPIGRIVALLSEAGAVFANDSGIAHLGAALGRKTAAVFTDATNPALSEPLGPDDCAKPFEAQSSPTKIADWLLSK